MPSKQRLILGGPGAGKTTRLLRIVEAALARGVPPERIAYCAFTRGAAEEAKSRAAKRFGLDEDKLVNFRTIHSMCFRELGMTSSDVVSGQHMTELGDMLSEDLNGELQEEDGPPINGNIFVTLDNHARTTMRSLEVMHHTADQEVEWFRLKRFVDSYRSYKEDRGLFDFTDMLVRFVKAGRSASVDVAIVDEGQDLSPLQWAVVDIAFRDAGELSIGGDDDQSVYRWSGADTDRFLSLPYQREVLPVSHRLPKAIFDLSQEIITRVGRRFPKDCSAGREGGRVEWVSRAEEVDMGKGTWLLLARTRHQLRDLENVARDQGVVYSMRGKSSIDIDNIRAIQTYENLRKGWRQEGIDTVYAMRALGMRTLEVDERRTYTAEELKIDTTKIWHDALIRIPLQDREYMLACRRRGELLYEAPRVRIDTIHGAKGAEAERAMVMTDLTYRIQKGFERDPDDEHRTFYVGATRASQELFLVSPRSAYGYAI